MLTASLLGGVLLSHLIVWILLDFFFPHTASRTRTTDYLGTYMVSSIARESTDPPRRLVGPAIDPPLLTTYIHMGISGNITRAASSELSPSDTCILPPARFPALRRLIPLRVPDRDSPGQGGGGGGGGVLLDAPRREREHGLRSDLSIRVRAG